MALACWLLVMAANCMAVANCQSAVRFEQGVSFQKISKPLASSSVAIKFVMDLKPKSLDSTADLDHLQHQLLRAGPDMAQLVNSTCTLMRQTHDSLSTHYSAVRGKGANLRSKRFTNPFALVGELLGFCCSVATATDLELLVDNDLNIQAQLDAVAESVDGLVNTTRINFVQWAEFAESVKEKFQEVDIMLTQLVNSKSQMEDWFTHVLLRTSSSLTEMILKLLMAERLENIYADCASNKIPRAAISPERLMEEVDSINKQRAGQAEVAVHSISGLYKLKLAACAITNEETLTILVKLPLKTSNQGLQLFDVLPLPFVFKGKVCSLFDDSTAVLMSNSAIKVLSTQQRIDCIQESVCPIPRSTMFQTDMAKCIHALYTNELPMQKLASLCKFNCHKYVRPEVIDLGKNYFLVVHPQSELLLTCPTNSRTVQPAVTGASKLEIPCDCTLQSEGHVIVDTHHPCDNRFVKVPKVFTVLPGLWSDVDISYNKLFSADLEYKSVSSVLATNLSLVMPQFFQPDFIRRGTKTPINTVPKSNSLVLYILIGVLLMWCTLLSAAVLLLWWRLSTTVASPAAPPSTRQSSDDADPGPASFSSTLNLLFPDAERTKAPVTAPRVRFSPDRDDEEGGRVNIEDSAGGTWTGLAARTFK